MIDLGAEQVGFIPELEAELVVGRVVIAEPVHPLAVGVVPGGGPVTGGVGAQSPSGLSLSGR